MYFSVKHVEPKDNYFLVLTFEDGEKKLFDMKPHLNKGIFRELNDIVLFNTVHVSFNSVAWANEADFDPEALYEGGLPLAD
jgi:Protein of unknown function (DUF2442)